MDGELTLYCDHISSNQVHCNKYKSLKVDFDTTVRDAIEDSDWGIVDDEVRCEEHK